MECDRGHPLPDPSPGHTVQGIWRPARPFISRKRLPVPFLGLRTRLRLTGGDCPGSRSKTNLNLLKNRDKSSKETPNAALPLCVCHADHVYEALL